MADLVFVVPGSLGTRTGGFLYDRHIVEGLRAAGWSVEVLELAGGFPFPAAHEVSAAEDRLASLSSGGQVVMDGLASGALPDGMEDLARRAQVTALVHHPLALETGLAPADAAALEASERRAVAASGRVITSSAMTARWLLERGWVRQMPAVVQPGTAAAPLSSGRGGGPLRLLTVGSLIPRKGHLLLLQALAELTELDWHLDIAGAARDPEAARAIAAAIEDKGLQGQVSLLGEVGERQLEALYAAADLFLLASYYEGFGMVVTEAVMRGLPVIATSGGAIPETLPKGCGLLSPPGEVRPLRENIARVLRDKGLRAGLRAATIEARKSLPSWQEAAVRFAAACGLQ